MFFSNTMNKFLPALSVFLLVALPAGASAQKSEDQVLSPKDASPIGRITIVGEGAVSVKPDIVVVILGKVTQSKTVATALSENNKAMATVLALLKAQGIDEKDLQTQNFSIQPQYHHSNNNRGRPPKIVGYQVVNQVRATIRNIESAASVLDGVVKSAANQIRSLQFMSSKTESARDEARVKAVANARKHAQLYAKAAGAELGKIIDISQEGHNAPRPRMQMRAMEMTADSSVPIEAGSQKVHASVRIVWQLK